MNNFAISLCVIYDIFKINFKFKKIYTFTDKVLVFPFRRTNIFQFY